MVTFAVLDECTHCNPHIIVERGKQWGYNGIHTWPLETEHQRRAKGKTWTSGFKDSQMRNVLWDNSESVWFPVWDRKRLRSNSALRRYTFRESSKPSPPGSMERNQPWRLRLPQLQNLSGFLRGLWVIENFVMQKSVSKLGGGKNTFFMWLVEYQTWLSQSSSGRPRESR